MDVHGQDVIITILGDSIHCKVDRADERFTYYRTTKTRRGATELISNREIRTINYQVSTQNAKLRVKSDSERFIKSVQIYADGGFSRLLSNDEVPEFYRNYDNNLRSGYSVSGGVNILFSNVIGAGVVIGQSSFSNIFNITGVGTLSDDIKMAYYGVNLALRFYTSEIQNFSLQFDLGLGLATYENDAKIIHSVGLSGQSLGGHAGLSFQLDLGHGFYIPATARFRGFSVGDITVSPGEDYPVEEIHDLLLDVSDSEPFSMYRFELVAGLLFTF